MSWAAAAVGAGAVLAWYTAEQNRKAQRDANRQNMEMTREGTRESGRQFDISQEEDVRRFGLGREDIYRSTATGREDAARVYGRGREDTAYGGMVDEERIRSQREAYRPYTEAGESALGEYQSLLGLKGAQASSEAQARFQETPGQRFLRERQEKTLLRNQAKIGGLRGGNVRTALQEQAAGIAATQQGEYMDRLYGLSGRGLEAGKAGGYAGTSDSALTRYGQVRGESEADQARIAEQSAADWGRIKGDEKARIIQEQKKREEEGKQEEDRRRQEEERRRQEELRKRSDDRGRDDTRRDSRRSDRGGY